MMQRLKKVFRNKKINIDCIVNKSNDTMLRKIAKRRKITYNKKFINDFIFESIAKNMITTYASETNCLDTTNIIYHCKKGKWVAV